MFNHQNKKNSNSFRWIYWQLYYIVQLLVLKGFLAIVVLIFCVRMQCLRLDNAQELRDSRALLYIMSSCFFEFWSSKFEFFSESKIHIKYKDYDLQ